MEGQWVRPPDPQPVTPAEYVQQLQAQLEWAHWHAQANLKAAQQSQKVRYDQGTRQRVFTVGDRVLVHGLTRPGQGNNPWEGLFPVTRIVGFSMGPGPAMFGPST